MKAAWILVLTFWSCIATAESTRADQSAFDHDFSNINSSRNLSKADLAWHALNSFGWSCEEVIDQQFPPGLKYSVITCKNGLKLRVYSRKDAFPVIRDMNGKFQ